MSNQQNDNVQVDENVQESQTAPMKHRPRQFYRRRPGEKRFLYIDFEGKSSFIGNDRKNQDLAEDENRASNDEDTRQSNNSDENNTAGISNSLFRMPIRYHFLVQ